MKSNDALAIIASPVGENYFPKQFIQECLLLNELEYAAPIEICDRDQVQIKDKTAKELHPLVDEYCSMLIAGTFPYLWTISDEGFNFCFSTNFEDFKQGDEYFSLGSDPSGDWFVLDKSKGSVVNICDKYSLEIRPEWKDVNNFFAWAVRVVLAENFDLSGEEIMHFWDKSKDKIDESTIVKIATHL
jgi:hypothetical protein